MLVITVTFLLNEFTRLSLKPSDVHKFQIDKVNCSWKSLYKFQIDFRTRYETSNCSTIKSFST